MQRDFTELFAEVVLPIVLTTACVLLLLMAARVAFSPWSSPRDCPCCVRD